MGRGQSGVRPASATSIEIDFYYRGARCRERLRLAPTKANLAFAERLHGSIMNDIALGTFDYARQFPDSKRGRHLTQSSTTFRTVADGLRAWLERARTELEHSTLIGHERTIERTLIPEFGAVLLRDLTRTRLREWTIEHTAGAKRINNLLAPLRQTYSDELDAGVIAVNPIAQFRVKRKRRADVIDPIDPFTPTELESILGKCEGQVHNLIKFAIWSGMRTSELMALRWREVDLKKMKVGVRAAFVLGARKAPKTAQGNRDVELLRPAADALKAQQAFTLLKSGAVFENPATNEPWKTDKQIREWNWRPLLKAAGVRYRPFKQCRHTFASMTLSVGENTLWVSRQLGHTDPTVTVRNYARFMKSVTPDAGQRTEALWPKN